MSGVLCVYSFVKCRVMFPTVRNPERSNAESFKQFHSRMADGNCIHAKKLSLIRYEYRPSKYHL